MARYIKVVIFFIDCLNYSLHVSVLFEVWGGVPGEEPGAGGDQHEEADHGPGEEGAGVHQDHSGNKPPASLYIRVHSEH